MPSFHAHIPILYMERDQGSRGIPVADVVRVIPTLTGLPPPAGAGENSRLTPMYDLRSVAVVAAVLLCE